MSAIVKNPRATTKRTATPYSCWKLKNAQTKATITSSDVTIPLTVAYNIALFKSMARRRRTGTSAPTLGPTHMAGKGRAGTGDGASEKASGRVTIRED